jgi:hypothetical protein
MNFENERNSPLPTTLEEYRIEVLALRSILKKERELLAKQWEMRSRDNKEAKGNIKALSEENRELKNKMETLAREVKNLYGENLLLKAELKDFRR